jgi:Flp pilus assembly pilin Flp
VWVAVPAEAEMTEVMHELYEQLRHALGREDGQGATEYGLVIALVLLSVASTVVILATSITNFLNGVGGLVDALIP